MWKLKKAWFCSLVPLPNPCCRTLSLKKKSMFTCFFPFIAGYISCFWFLCGLCVFFFFLNRFPKPVESFARRPYSTGVFKI